MPYTFHLVGPLEGRTMVVGSRANRLSFVNGTFVFNGTQQEAQSLARYLQACGWAQMGGGDGQRDHHPGQTRPAHPVGNRVPAGSGSEANQSSSEGHGHASSHPGGETGLAGGDRHAEGVTSPDLVVALGRLDPGTDAHWTADGWPSVSAVCRLAGGRPFTRSQIMAARPPRRPR